MICMVPENIPSDRAGLTAAETCHDRMHIAGHKVQFSIICLCSPENTVCLIRFHNCNNRSFLIAIKTGKVTAYRTGHGSYTGLQKDMGGFFAL